MCSQPSPEHINNLIETLSDEDRMARWNAVQELISLQELAIAPLIAALGHKHEKVREGAATALSRMGAFAIAPLVKALGTSEVQVRSFAVWALGEAGDSRAVEPLIALANDGSTRVRSRVIWALARICEPLEKDQDLRSAATVAMCAALDDEKPLVRQTAAESLARIAAISSVGRLITAMDDENTKVRENVAQALGRVKDARATTVLINALTDEHVWVRITAARALGEIVMSDEDQQRTIEGLKQLLFDNTEPLPGERVCDVAADVLRIIDTHEAKRIVEAWQQGTLKESGRHSMVGRLRNWLRGNKP